MNNRTNVTATGIAVACAVIVAIGLLFFGPGILNFFNPSASQNSAQSTSTTMQENPQSQTNTSTSTLSDISLSDIPANVTQLMTKDITAGTGTEAQQGDQVTVNYVGMLTNGQVFDASANHGDQGFTFTLGAGQVIKGWDQGVIGMKVGGKRELVIPASLGYGSQAVGPIPANSTLIFEVQLLNVQSAQ